MITQEEKNKVKKLAIDAGYYVKEGKIFNSSGEVKIFKYRQSPLLFEFVTHFRPKSSLDYEIINNITHTSSPIHWHINVEEFISFFTSHN